jgi:predicted acyltransferase
MTEIEKPRRLVSLDQYRGYTVAGMFVVNWLGAFLFTPEILKHHRTWCSYADTIMPQFFFAAGFALRLVWLRMAEKSPADAYARLVRRGLGLFVFGVIFYQFDDKWKAWTDLTALGWRGFFTLEVWRQPFQALVHIAVTSLWLLPVIGRSARVRIVFALLSAGLHLWLSRAFWFELLLKEGVIDGGPLGFLTWTLPTVAGTLAYDAVLAGWKMQRLAACGAVCMAAGYAVSCLTNGGSLAAPPFFANPLSHDIWTMSQKAGSASYLLFGAGFSLALYALFRILCDTRGWRLTLFSDLGSNALAAYVLHGLVMDALEHLAPRDSPAWWALSTGALHFGLIWWMVRWLNAKGLYLRL